jgi:hypothetical protein
VSKVVRKIAPIASIALPIIAPGFGTAIGAALGAGAAAAPIVGNAVLGAGLGAAGGDGLKGAAIGGVTGGLGGGGGAQIAGKLGATGAAKTALGSAITGGASSALKGGDVGDIALGAATAAGASQLGSLGGGQSSYQTSEGGIPLPPTKPLQTTSGINIGGQPVKLGSLLSGAGDVYGYMQGQSDLEDIQNQLAQQSQQAQAQLQPYAQAGQQALQNLEGGYDAFTQDPGYQFRLQQGNQALERSLAARGLGQSGAALKAAQQYGQGLAEQSYGDYFGRQSQLAGQGLGAAGGLGSLMTNLGNTQAAATLAGINQRNELLSNLGNNKGLGQLMGGLFGR